MQPFIVQGDKTDHGGTVLVGSPFSDCAGKPIARVGDMVACPKCKGVFPISQGDSSNIVDGSPVAYHGCRVACGAILISSQLATQTNPSSGAAPRAGDSDGTEEALERFGAIGAGLAAAYEDEQAADDGRFRGRFQLINLETGLPIKGEPVRFGPSDGTLAPGATDDDGYTAWAERGVVEALAFRLAQGEHS